MQIQINTDHNVEGHERFAEHVQGVVENSLGRFAQDITRVEVHLSDQNTEKGGQNDKRCVMEARLQGREPLAVSHDAATVGQAVDGAAQKLKRSVETTLDRLRSHR
jgi:ribosome-associated translation inhibitor RaiA